jgi:hypothetical protein
MQLTQQSFTEAVTSYRMTGYILNVARTFGLDTSRIWIWPRPPSRTRWYWAEDIDIRISVISFASSAQHNLYSTRRKNPTSLLKKYLHRGYITQSPCLICVSFHTVYDVAYGRAISWATMLQAGRSRGRFPYVIGFFNLPNPSSRSMAPGSTRSLTEMSTRNIPGGKGRPVRKGDNLTAICAPIVYRKCRSVDVSQPYGPPWPVTGAALPFSFTFYRLWSSQQLRLEQGKK